MKWFFVLLLALPVSAVPTQKWEVAVIFLAANEEAGYQMDIDKNILELATSNPGKFLSLHIFRELPDHTIEYHADPTSKELYPWQPLFSIPPPENVLVAGEMIEEKREATQIPLVKRPDRLKTFLSRSFIEKKAKRILVIYSHGEAFDGLGDNIPVLEFRENLKNTLPARTGKPLDILWLDACFMANLEFLQEVHDLAEYAMASEEAEFASGSPFDMLALLASGKATQTQEVAQRFAERFIESYSYYLEGAQRLSVVQSPATISVIDLAQIPKLTSRVADLSKALGVLTPHQRDYLRHNESKFSMARPEIYDLGAMILGMARSRSFDNAKPAIQSLRDLLELSQSTQLNHSPRIKIAPTNPKTARMVFGYNDWEKGDERDVETFKIMPEVLQRNVTFVRGEKGKDWPSIPVDHNFFLSPFSVNLTKFNYYFLDVHGNKLSRNFGIVRYQDFIYKPSRSPENPIVWNGFTQGIGNWTNRYTGLSLLNPANGIPSVAYLDLQFSMLTGWGNL